MEAVTGAFGSLRAGFKEESVCRGTQPGAGVALQGTRRKLRKNALKSGRVQGELKDQNEDVGMDLLRSFFIYYFFPVLGLCCRV